MTRLIQPLVETVAERDALLQLSVDAAVRRLSTATGDPSDTHVLWHCPLQCTFRRLATTRSGVFRIASAHLRGQHGIRLIWIVRGDVQVPRIPSRLQEERKS